MELFSINRYKDEGVEQPKAKENELLEKLLRKVEERKRKKNQEINKKVETENKKSKKSDCDLVAETEDLITPASKDVDPISAETEVDTGGVGFEVLGNDVSFSKRPKVDMVLPTWLAHPTVISTSIIQETDADAADAITKLPYLAAHTRHVLKQLSVTRLFPVQSAVIPWILDAHSKPAPFRPRDICVSAPTGSGKTLAFAIPIVQLLEQRVERKIRALIVLPVAELALQVYRVFKQLCENTDLAACLLSKQMPFPLEQEKLVECYKGKYYAKIDIVVTTPGRLVDHLHATKGFCLKSLKFLVIDEADRIMDAVFQNWLYHLDAHVRTSSEQLLAGRAAPLCYNELLHNIKTQPHKLLFSATLSQDPEKLQNLRLFQPKLFTSVLSNLQLLREKYVTATELEQQLKQKGALEMRGEFIGKYTTPAELTEKYCLTESRLKPLTLFSLINENRWRKFLCFTNSAESAGRLAFVLSEMCKNTDTVVRELSASKSAQDRANLLSQLARGRINGLICSDALARGIDIPDVDIVISYDPPRHIKTYIHRIGRTARAGRRGTAITLLSQKELNQFNQMLAEVDKTMTEEICVSGTTEEQHASNYSAALRELRNKLEKEKRSKILLKERTKTKAFLHKDPSKLTLMEKLQAQVNAQVLDNVQETQEQLVISRREMKLGNVKRKKVKASSGKQQKTAKQ